MEISEELFEQLSECVNEECHAHEGELLSLLYEALGAESNHVSIIFADIKPLTDDVMNNWKEFDGWLMYLNLELHDIIEFDPSDIDNNVTESGSPGQYFGSKEAIKEKVLYVLSNNDSRFDNSIAYVEVTCGEKRLYLVYTGFDGWVTGWADWVWVYDSLDHLNEANGFYIARESVN